MPLLCGDPKTEEFDDCDLGDCTKLEGLCFSSHHGLITADCWCWLHRQTPKVWLDLPLECQVSQRLSPLCRSASNKLSLPKDDKYWDKGRWALQKPTGLSLFIVIIYHTYLVFCADSSKNWFSIKHSGTFMVQQQSLQRIERCLGSLCIQLYRMLRSHGDLQRAGPHMQIWTEHTDDKKCLLPFWEWRKPKCKEAKNTAKDIRWQVKQTEGQMLIADFIL